MSLVQLKTAVGNDGLFDYLVTRAAMRRGHSNSLGMNAVSAEFKLRMETGSVLIKVSQIVNLWVPRSTSVYGQFSHKYDFLIL
jgi:hypothetical protein